jgi:glycosyltransferase involved in cell wall biosynthesis
MIDAHVIRYHSLSKPELFERCADSLRHPKVNIHVVTGRKDPHFGELRVQGFSKGRNKYVTFLDDDDYLYPGAVDTILDAIGDNDFAISAYSIDGNFPEVGIIPDSLNYSIARKRLRYFQGFKIVKRKVVEQYYPILNKTRYMEDAILWLALTKHHTGTIVKEQLLHRSLHGGNATTTLPIRDFKRNNLRNLTNLL